MTNILGIAATALALVPAPCELVWRELVWREGTCTYVEADMRYVRCIRKGEAFLLDETLSYLVAFREELSGAVSRIQYEKVLEDNIRLYTSEKVFATRGTIRKDLLGLKDHTPDAISRAELALESQGYGGCGHELSDTDI